MARILLNVDLDAKSASTKLTNIRKSIELIASSLADIKPNKDLTDQIKALSDYYQKIAEASKNARESLHAEEIQQQRLAEATAAANRARAEERAAMTREREAATDLANAQERLEEIQEQHEHNQQRRELQNNRQSNQLVILEGRYADLAEKIRKLGESFSVLDERDGTNVSAPLADMANRAREANAELTNMRESNINDLSRVRELGNAYTTLSTELKNLVLRYKEVSEEARSQYDELQKSSKATEQAAKEAEKLKTTYYGMQSTISNLEKQYPAGTFDSIKTAITNALNSFDRLDRTSEDYVSDVQNLKREHDQLAQSLAKTKAETDKLDNSEEKHAKSLEKAANDVENMRIKLYNMLTAISNIEGRYPEGTFDEIKEDVLSYIKVLLDLDKTDDNFVEDTENTKKAVKDLEVYFASLKATTDHVAPSISTLGDRFGNLVEKYAKFYASSLLVRKPLQLIQNALEDVGETLVKTEDAVIELNRVLNDPQPAMEAANRLYDIAYKYGSTFENASLIAANFARAGKSWNESIQATEAALLAMNVAELNATEASDGLLSVIAQFDMDASDLIDVVDKLNKTADKNPVSTQKLLQAIQRAGSAAKNANVSFDQTLGLITAISEATNRSGQNIGTAINSLIQYSTKNIDTFATLSKESEEMVEKFKLGLVSIVDVWNQVSEDIQSDKSLRDKIITDLGTDGLEELSSTLHDELGDLVSEIDGVYSVANTYRKNYFIALLDNMDRFMKVQEQLTDYQGYSQEENAKYMETYTAKVNQLQDAWQKLANDEQGILGFKKTLAELGIDLVGFVEQSGGIVETTKDFAGIIGGLALMTKGEALLKLLVNLKTVLIESYRELGKILTGAAGGFQQAVGWIGFIIAAYNIMDSALNAARASQAAHRKEVLEEFEANKENITALSELKKKYDEGNLSLEEQWELEEQIVPLLGDKKIALENVTSKTAEYSEKLREEIGLLQEEQKLQAQLAQDSAKNDFIEAARQALEDDAKAYAASLNWWAKLSQDVFGSWFSGFIVDSYEDAVRQLEAARANLEWAKKDYLDSRDTDISDADLKKKLEYYLSMIEIVNTLEAARDKYEKERIAGEIAELEATDNLTKAQESRLALLKAINEEHITGREGVVPSIKEETEALEKAGETAEEAGVKYDKAALGATKFAEAIAGDKDNLKAEADAIKAVKAAQDEFNENGGLSIETITKLASLGEDWVDVLFDENGAVDVTSNAVYYLLAAKNELLEKNGVLIDSTEEETAAVDAVTEKLKDYSAQIDEAQSSLSVLDEVQKEYDETGSLSIDTFQKLLELGGEYLDLIIDEEGQLRLNEDAVNDLKNKKLELIEQLIRENTAQYALSLIQEKAAEKEKDVGTQAENAALKIGEFVGTLYTLKGQSSEATVYLEALRQKFAQIGSEMGISLTEADLDEITSKTTDYYAKLQSVYGFVDTTGGWQSSSGSSSSSSGSQKDEVLEGHKDLVSLLESELTLMEHQGKSEEEQIAKIREIQSAIATQADYMRSIGASQEEINKLSSEWWKWEEKINKFAEDRQKAAEKAAEEAEKERQKAEQEAKKAAEEAEKAAKKAEEEAKKAAEEAEKARIKALNDETARHKQVVSDLKAELNLWQKQGKSVSDQVEEMKKIQDGLHEEAEWLRHLQATEKDIAVTQAEIDALSAEWWDWQEKILKLYEDTLKAARDIELEAQQKVIDDLLKSFDDIEASRKEELEINEKILAVENARKDVADAIRNAQLDYIKSTLSGYIKSLSDAKTLEEKQNAVIEARKKLVEADQDARAKAIIDAFKAEKSVKSDALSIEEKRLAVEKARQALIDAENERTTRVYNESSGQWEYQANAKNVQTAQENLQKAIDALNAYVEEQAWKEVSEAVENGSVSEAEVLSILDKWARESYGEGSPEFVAKIQGAFRKAMGTPASPESLSGQVSAVDKAVENLNEYLKQEAVKELEQYIAAGNTDSAGMRSILDKWLSMGEGGELYEWRDGLLDNLESAISSGWYDETKVTSYIDKVDASIESLHEYLRSRFIAEIKDIAKNGTAEELEAALEKWDERFDSVGDQIGVSDFGLSDEDKSWGKSVAEAKGQKETTESMWEKAMAGDKSSGTINWVMARMKQNSAAWWEADKAGDAAEKKRLADENFALGTAMGWHRKENGHWYDEYDRQVYDKGGILHGRGGIKATNRPEAVLDPDLTAKILSPTSEKQFRAFADMMHLVFEKGGRNRYDMPVIRNPSVTDSHNTSYTVNGIPIPAASAERYTVAELFRMLPMARF